MCDALRAALTTMLKDRQAPSDYAICNGSARGLGGDHGHGNSCQSSGVERGGERSGVAAATPTAGGGENRGNHERFAPEMGWRLWAMLWITQFLLVVSWRERELVDVRCLA